MKAILIEPAAHCISVVLWNGHLQEIYNLLGVDIVEAVHPRHTSYFITLYVDEEGLYRPDQQFFQIAGYPSPLAGRALMVGPPDTEGNDTELELGLITVSSLIEWVVPLSSVMGAKQ